MRANRFAFYLIPLLGIAAIPQILFFWLAPEVQCYITVYVFGTIITLAQLIITFAAWMRFGVRRTAAITVVGCCISLAMWIAGGILLGFSASIRTALYCLSIIAVVYVAAVTPLILSVLDAPEENRQTPQMDARSGNTFHPEMPGQNLQGYVTCQRGPEIPERHTVSDYGENSPASRQQTPPPLPERR